MEKYARAKKFFDHCNACVSRRRTTTVSREQLDLMAEVQQSEMEVLQTEREDKTGHSGADRAVVLEAADKRRKATRRTNELVAVFGEWWFAGGRGEICGGSGENSGGRTETAGDEKEKAVAKVDELRRMQEQAKDDDEDCFAGTVGPDGLAKRVLQTERVDKAGQVVLEATQRERDGVSSTSHARSSLSPLSDLDLSPGPVPTTSSSSRKRQRFEGTTVGTRTPSAEERWRERARSRDVAKRRRRASVERLLPREHELEPQHPDEDDEGGVSVLQTEREKNKATDTLRRQSKRRHSAKGEGRGGRTTEGGCF